MTEIEIPTWRHPNTGKLHLDPRCRAVRWYSDRMAPGVIYASNIGMVCEMADLQGDWCEWCMTRIILGSEPVVSEP